MLMPGRSALVYFVVGFVALGMLVMMYSARMEIANTSQNNYPAIRMAADLSYLDWSPADMGSRRKQPVNGGNPQARMLHHKLHDDYNFCVKTVPFEGPFNFIRNSRNPCWYNKDDVLKCIPHFYLAGFSKSGTTDLFHRILSHPHVMTDKKEKHWLDFIRYFQDKGSVDVYSKMFSRVTKMIANEIDDHDFSNIVIGDGTPCYAWDSLYWRCYEGNEGLSQPKYTNADVIHRMNPRSKIIMVLRDPVTRLYSRYLSWSYKLKDRIEFTDPSSYHFHNLCLRAIQLYNECFKQWSHRHCAYNGTLYGQAKLRLQEGMYPIFIKDWLKVFPRNQILILKFEDYVKNVPVYLHRIYSFLGVGRLTNESVDHIATLKARNVGAHYDIGPMLEETTELLQKFYAPFNKDLQHLLDDPFWSWGYE